jgi:hypothetical protein
MYEKGEQLPYQAWLCLKARRMILTVIDSIDMKQYTLYDQRRRCHSHLLSSLLECLWIVSLLCICGPVTLVFFTWSNFLMSFCWGFSFLVSFHILFLHSRLTKIIHLFWHFLIDPLPPPPVSWGFSIPLVIQFTYEKKFTPNSIWSSILDMATGGTDLPSPITLIHYPFLGTMAEFE